VDFCGFLWICVRLSSTDPRGTSFPLRTTFLGAEGELGWWIGLQRRGGRQPHRRTSGRRRRSRGSCPGSAWASSAWSPRNATNANARRIEGGAGKRITGVTRNPMRTRPKAERFIRTMLGG
jgi:hypothetical protein